MFIHFVWHFPHFRLKNFVDENVFYIRTKQQMFAKKIEKKHDVLFQPKRGENLWR